MWFLYTFLKITFPLFQPNCIYSEKCIVYLLTVEWHGMNHYHHHIQKVINNFKVYFLHIALPLLSFSIFNIWHPRFLPGSLLSLPVLWSYCLFPMNPGSWKVTMEYFIMSRKDLFHLVNISETASKSLSLFVRSQCVYLQHL